MKCPEYRFAINSGLTSRFASFPLGKLEDLKTHAQITCEIMNKIKNSEGNCFPNISLKGLNLENDFSQISKAPLSNSVA